MARAYSNLHDSVWLRKQLKGTAWLSAVSSQSGRDTRGRWYQRNVGTRVEEVPSMYHV